jgi:hypothetical protein
VNKWVICINCIKFRFADHTGKGQTKYINNEQAHGGSVTKSLQDYTS